MGTKVHRQVWRRSRESHNVRSNTIYWYILILNVFMWKAGGKVQEAFRLGFTYFSMVGIQAAYSLALSWYNFCFSSSAEFKQPLLQESGFPRRLPHVLNQQKYFDGLVEATNCTKAKDRLRCLRAAPYAKLMAAINRSPHFLSYDGLNTWGPMIDGKVIKSSPLKLLQSGKYAKVLHTGCLLLKGFICFTGSVHSWRLWRRRNVSVLHASYDQRLNLPWKKYLCHFHWKHNVRIHGFSLPIRFWILYRTNAGFLKYVEK